MSKSVERVRQAAHDAGLDIEIRQMADSTHTAGDAAIQCGVTVAQIVKSLIFQGADTDKLYLFLVSGPRKLDLEKAAKLTGEKLHSRRSEACAQGNRLCHWRCFTAGTSDHHRCLCR